MPLYVVVHHEADEKQPWRNAWHNADLIEAIQTTNEIGALCCDAQAKKDRVYVHRCGWGDFAPVVCCSAEVEDVAQIDRATVLVRFARPIPLGQKPPKTPVKGQNFYLA